MPFPWGQPLVDLAFTCKHCGAIHRNENNQVAVCSCPASEQERAEQVERDRMFQRQQRDRQQIDFQTAREQNKLRSRH